MAQVSFEFRANFPVTSCPVFWRQYCLFLLLLFYITLFLFVFMYSPLFFQLHLWFLPFRITLLSYVFYAIYLPCHIDYLESLIVNGEQITIL